MRLAPTLAFAAALSLVSPGAATARSTPRGTPPRAALPARLAIVDTTRHFDANRINMLVSNLGSIAYDLGRPALPGGLEYPRGSGKTAVFASGLWLGARVAGETRVTVAEYTPEYGPGPMRGGTFVPDSTQFRVWKVHAWSGDPGDTAHVTRPAGTFVDPLAHDSWSEYLNGAAPYGAPVRTWRLPRPGVPGDSVDIPGPDVRGDQMLWCVYNDADPTLHGNEAGFSAPLGVEVRQTVFGFDRPDPLGSTVFLRYQIANRGANTLDSMYVSLWSDPDVGDFTDDLVGCDSTRGLGFAYNADHPDRVYGAAAPAVGYVVIRGPIAAPGDTLGLSSFTRYIGGIDPVTAQQSYWYMQGLDLAGNPIVNPATGFVTRTMMSGDPLTGRGWVDLYGSDKRMMLTSGPVRLAPGDTTELVAAIVIGPGQDALSSVGLAECWADAARAAYRSGFNSLVTPAACPAPRACPEPASFWARACATPGTELTPRQLSSVATAVSRSDASLHWPAGAEADSFCATINPPGGGDVRQQARREFAALVANVCAGDSGIVSLQGDTIFVPRGVAVTAPGALAPTVGALITRGSLSSIAASCAAVSFDGNDPPLAGVDIGLPSFGGGGGFAADVFPSALDPVHDPGAFSEADIGFAATGTQRAYRYLRLERASDGAAPPQGRGYLYGGFRDVPFEVWKPSFPLQPLDAAFVERCLTDDAGTILPAAQQPASFDSTWAPDTSRTGGGDELIVLDQPYTGNPVAQCQVDGAIASGTLPGLYILAARLARPGASLFTGGIIFQSDPFRSAGVDSMLLALAGQPLASPGVAQAYRDIATALAAVNAGTGVAARCGAPSATLVLLQDASFVNGGVRLAWSTTAGAGIQATVERSDGSGPWMALGQVTSDAGGAMRFDDGAVLSGHSYAYRLSAPGVVAAGEASVTIPPPTSTILFGARPNPARGDLDVAFALPANGPARLQLFDLTGRRLRDVDVGALGPGFHLVRLSQGARVPAGVYVVRLTTQGRSVTRKAVVLR